MSDEQAFCEKCGYTAPVVSAETGGFLFCAVCDARDRARDFCTERDEARAELSRLRADCKRMTAALYEANELVDIVLDDEESNFKRFAQKVSDLIAAALADKPGDTDHV